MMKLLALILLYTFNIFAVYSQVTNMGVTNRFEGSGKIDKYEIEFILDVIIHPYYEDGDHVGEIQQFSGKYFYKNHEKNIFLCGTRQILFRQSESIMDDSIKLYEVDENFNKTAVFTGVLNKTSFQGNWVSVKNVKNLPFNIIFDQSKFTLLEVETSKGTTTLPFNSLSEYFNKYNQNEYKIIKIIEKNNKTYVLVSLAFTVCGAIKSRGSGCGDHHVFLRLYEVDKFTCKYSELQLMGHSFIDFEEKVDKNKYSVMVKSIRDDIITKKAFEVKFSQIEKGILEIKL